MGHHASKHKNKSSGTKTTSRLSSSSKPTKSTSISNSKSGSVPKPTSTLTSSQKFTKESRPLGSKDNEDISNGINNNIPMNAREALARAAEERYKKLQEQKMGQSDRLRAKAKQSKNDKGL